MPYAPTVHAPRRTVGFALVLMLHAGIFYALQSGLARSVIDLVKGPMETRVIPDEVVEKEVPPPPPPKFDLPPPPQMIMPEITIEAPTQASNAISAAPREVQKVEPVVAAPVTVPPRTNPRRPLTEPEFPPTSQRLQEQGTVELQLTVDPDGKVVEATVLQSSGYERLDNAAVTHAIREWRLLPGTVGGKPTAMQVRKKVVFNYRN